jgi:hypothetical protein
MRNRWIYGLVSMVMMLAFAGGCSRSDDPGNSTQKVDVTFFAEKSGPTLKNGSLDLDAILAELDCDDVLLGEDAATNYRLMVRLTGPNAFDETYFLTFDPVGGGVASELVQLNADATYSIERFALVEKIDQNGEWTVENTQMVMATPENESAFMDYVAESLPFVFTVGQYEKNRIEIDLLCFNQQIAPAFGFDWFDYNIVQGDEVCVFINCINENDRENYHRVYPSYLTAWVPLEVNSGDAYWDIGPNYTVENNAITGIHPVCFPLYAPAIEMTDGLTLEIQPAFGELSNGEVIYSDVFMVTIPQSIILEYLGLTSYVGDPVLIDEVRGIMVKVDLAPDPNVDNPRFIHLEYLNCLEDPNDPGGDCETAFAYNETYSSCFFDFSYLVPTNRWGWTNGPLEPSGTAYEFTMLAGAGGGQNEDPPLCHPENGVNAGTLTVNYDGSFVSLSVNISAAFNLTQIHAWVAEGNAGDDPDPRIPHYEKNNGDIVYTLSPGKYTVVDEGLTENTWNTTLDGFGGGDIYVIVHAAVCPALPQ